MANTTVRGAFAIHGQNQQASFIHIFTIQPEKEILLEYLQADEFKALATMYIRMTFDAAEVYEIFEPLSSKISESFAIGVWVCCFKYAHSLLREERVILPRITKREVLEDTGEIGPRKSRLLDAMEGKSEHGTTEVVVGAEVGVQANAGVRARVRRKVGVLAEQEVGVIVGQRQSLHTSRAVVLAPALVQDQMSALAVAVFLLIGSTERSDSGHAAVAYLQTGWIQRLCKYRHVSHLLIVTVCLS
ncbi:Pre-mRNA-splicing factor 38A [Grifola frondosa]|uniref:Pre-mRNA-splicing factor 38 n=1 Tax=Grifola frondosa TaxID=5627 RepID=A0A1C7MCD4_GRIFR|nr:Pre-mRNA-splicing factor 38A [Grifola frondosa]